MVKGKKVRFFKGFDFETWLQAIVSVVVVIVVLGGVLGGTIYIMVSNTAAKYTYQRTVTYYVGQGDTLWVIAQNYSDPKIRMCGVIDIIEDINDCTADIYPGDTLEIPVFDCLGG